MCSRVDIYDKLPVPFGLVRFGVAPDHPEVKNVINSFTKVGSDPRVQFIGNVSLGSDVKLADLRRAYDAVVLCYGADQDVELKIPGENLPNVISARRFVGWYNGLPADKSIPVNLNVEDVTIFGQGNVAIDVARILLKSVDDLKATDITEHALAKLAESKVKIVRLIGRRGVLQVAFTIKEFREISNLSDVRTLIDNSHFEDIISILQDLPRPRKRLTELLLKTASESEALKQKTKILQILFLRSPLEFTGNERINGVKLAVNRFKNLTSSTPTESQQIEMTDKKEFLSTELIFRSIGYKCSKAEPEIPFNFFNCIGNARVMPGVYCAGWLQSGPVGVILSTMTDAFTTANHIFQDIQNSVIRCEKSKPGYELIKPILRERGIPIVNWEGWKKIDELEVRRGKTLNKPREKITDINEMLNVGGCHV